MLRGRHRGLPHAIDRAGTSICAHHLTATVTDDYCPVVLPREYMDDTLTNGANNSGLDLPGNRQSTGAETGVSFDGAHSTSRAVPHGVDLKHRTNTHLSPVHEILTPVTSVINTPKPTSLGVLGAGN
jgi:hypothetical protein